jgi:hypothetical protein
VRRPVRGNLHYAGVFDAHCLLEEGTFILQAIDLLIRGLRRVPAHALVEVIVL